MAYPLQAGILEAGDYEHGLKTAQTESRPRSSWINELRLQHGVQSFSCATFRCMNQASHGAHLRVSFVRELLSFVGKGGQAVVPMCAPCHDGAKGGPVKVNRTPCVWDKNSPYDL